MHNVHSSTQSTSTASVSSEAHGLSPEELSHAALETWRDVTTKHPLVQCITNTVVQPITANVLLAGHAAPAMIDIVGEAGIFAGVASAVLINLGTIAPSQQEAIPEATAAAKAAGTPWVLDPVGVGGLPVRTALAVKILADKPAVIRGNASEIIALNAASGGSAADSAGRGVDAGDSVEAAAPAARELAARTGAVVAVSGPIDLITDGSRSIHCANGSALLTQVTGGGCALGGFIAAYAASASDTLLAVAAAHACYGVAAEIAAGAAAGPGTFAASLLDALNALDEPTLIEGIRLEAVAA